MSPHSPSRLSSQAMLGREHSVLWYPSTKTSGRYVFRGGGFSPIHTSSALGKHISLDALSVVPLPPKIPTEATGRLKVSSAWALWLEIDLTGTEDLAP